MADQPEALRIADALEGRWALHPEMQQAAAELRRLEREVEVLRAERDHARAQFQFSVRLLTGIHNLLYPAQVRAADGLTMVFRPENPHEFMQALSDRIRALPEEIAAIAKVKGGGNG